LRDWDHAWRASTKQRLSFRCNADADGTIGVELSTAMQLRTAEVIE
jgi:hypothetical protein